MKTTRPIIPVPAPPIITPRLLLRPFAQSDLAEFHRLRTQIEVMKWTSTGKADVDQQVTQVWMNGFLPPNDAITFNFAVEELSAPGIVIGVLGCKTLEPPEVGYMFSPQAWGKGYATEALQKWLEVWWALPRKAVVLEAKDVDEDEDSREMLIPEVLMADMDSSNKASARIVTKCGFRQVSEGVVQQNGAAVRITVFELNRPQHN